ncbi:MAG: hypothetical protein WBM40_24545, partial [Thiohalocapsa sp.]
DRATTAFMRSLLSLQDDLSAAGRDRQLLAQDDQTLLTELLIQALRADPLVSKELRLGLRGQLALHSLLAKSGGALTAAEVAELFDITEDAVRKRARRGKLLALPRGGRSVYPAFQFDLGRRCPVSGLDTVLALLDTDSAPAKLRFFLTPDQDLGAAPIEVLRAGDADARALLQRKARQFGVHLAA